MEPTIKAGVVVICLNNYGAEHLLKKGYVYRVVRALNNGKLVFLEDVEGTFAADRFTVVSDGSGSTFGAFASRNYYHAGN